MDLGDTMVNNFVQKYGIDGLGRIIFLFREQISNQKIANEFGVTRQRVHQWQKAFTRTNVTPTESVRKLLFRKC